MKSLSLFWVFLFCVILAIGCGSNSSDTSLSSAPGTELGDPDTGRDFMINENYVGCGIPMSVFDAGIKSLNLYSKLGKHKAEFMTHIDGRNERNKTMPYFVNQTTSESGVDMVSPNCLLCHSQAVDGKTIIGLGNTTFDYTVPFLDIAMRASPILAKSNEERVELKKFTKVGITLAPYIRTSTVIANPAMQIAAVLGAHRDPYTLEWQDEPLYPMPSKDHAPIDTPPWWRMKYRDSMFYNGEYVGVHRRPMMGSSALCINDLDDALNLDDDFKHVEAFVKSIKPPKYPFEINKVLADSGKEVFKDNCAKCHGYYHENGDVDYLEEFIDIEEIKTDPALMEQQNWFWATYGILTEGFYGELGAFKSRSAYLAPPLVGIWATAPFLHNGSVPTLAELLDPDSRPTYWKVNDLLSTKKFDEERVGWEYEKLPEGKKSTINPLKKSYIYDTTLPGYGNYGHDYGKALTVSQRKAVLEYLKTL